jgi:hypothetical protein
MERFGHFRRKIAPMKGGLWKTFMPGPDLRRPAFVPSPLPGRDVFQTPLFERRIPGSTASGEVSDFPGRTASQNTYFQEEISNYNQLYQHDAC